MDVVVVECYHNRLKHKHQAQQ